MEIKEKIQTGSVTIGIIGLGYVGLPLAVEFGKYFKTIGFDISQARISELQSGVDRTLEVSPDELASSKKLTYTSDKEALRDVDIYIVTVPTPIDVYNRPDLTPLIKASETVGATLQPGNIAVYESTVYPGCTEEDCVPVIEKFSGLKFNKDFYCGYSPERINPGDKLHRVSTIKKIVSGSTPEIGEALNVLYGTIIKAGTHLAKTMKVAEAAKVIENTQRDINIAFVNELAKCFDLMGIDTQEVLDAAGTKWNFLPFRPGLVGGHCIGVDPYYLTHKAAQLGYHPEVILAGRRINDGMGAFVAQKIIKHLIKQNISVKGAKVLMLGITFKENCPDIRNSKVIDIINELEEYGCVVETYDPNADPADVLHEYNITLLPSNITPVFSDYQAVTLAVAHDAFKKLDFSVRSAGGTVVYDVKGMLPVDVIDGRL
jgi:UDP-N-acetyl-D-galactosamine dehydrogenase